MLVSMVACFSRRQTHLPKDLPLRNVPWRQFRACMSSCSVQAIWSLSGRSGHCATIANLSVCRKYNR